YPNEYEHCLKDGVRFRWNTQPVRVLTDAEGAVLGLECAVVALGEPGLDGRRMPILTEELFTIPADHVLLATGQRREPSLFEGFGLIMERDGRPVVTDRFATSDARVYVGGDSVLTGKELSVVDAVAQGRDAAIAIDRFLRRN
ncbi:MAG: dihydropyrimidine dehydrogenase, partial [Thermoleophilia bacterium]|nr:dihydropyrimidine dehydrogenase [Thermoleophilia bacterium]